MGTSCRRESWEQQESKFTVAAIYNQTAEFAEVEDDGDDDMLYLQEDAVMDNEEFFQIMRERQKDFQIFSSHVDSRRSILNRQLLEDKIRELDQEDLIFIATPIALALQNIYGERCL